MTLARDTLAASNKELHQKGAINDDTFVALEVRGNSRDLSFTV